MVSNPPCLVVPNPQAACEFDAVFGIYEKLRGHTFGYVDRYASPCLTVLKLGSALVIGKPFAPMVSHSG